MSFDPERAKGLDAIIQIEFLDEGAHFLKISDGNLELCSGTAPAARITLKGSFDDFLKIFERKLDVGSAYFQGRLIAQGDIYFAIKLADLFNRAD